MASAHPVRSFAAVASPWGSDTWRYDKNSFLAWCTEATSKKDSAARRELYGLLAMRFGDTDVDKDGKINAAEFDGLCEDIYLQAQGFKNQDEVFFVAFSFVYCQRQRFAWCFLFIECNSFGPSRKAGCKYSCYRFAGHQDPSTQGSNFAD